jgi:antitoxin component YwqK of YwqJK toxin-antitoxin module
MKVMDLLQKPNMKVPLIWITAYQYLFLIYFFSSAYSFNSTLGTAKDILAVTATWLFLFSGFQAKIIGFKNLNGICGVLAFIASTYYISLGGQEPIDTGMIILVLISSGYVTYITLINKDFKKFYQNRGDVSKTVKIFSKISLAVLVLVIVTITFYEPDGPRISYHDNGQLKEKGNYTNGKQEGTWVSYHDNGQLSSKGNYKNGWGEGAWVLYYRDGQLRRKGNYTNGKKEGPWLHNWGSGLLWKKGNYKNGKKEGAWIKKSYSCRGFNQRSEVPPRRVTCQERKKESFYKNGIRNGLWVLTDNSVEIYYENGKSLIRKIVKVGVSKGKYNNGMREGPWVEYNRYRDLEEKGNYKNGKKDGSWITYNSNGQLSSKGNYKNGKREGDWVWYFYNGKLNEKGNYKNGKKEGEWVTYFSDGQLIYKGNYKNGKKVSD